MKITCYKILILILICQCIVFAKSPDLILKSANSNINTMSKNGEVISVLNGNVVFLYDDATIKSQYAKWWRNTGVVAFSDQVTVLRNTQTMTSDRLDYDKGKKTLKADGKLNFGDTKERIHLVGNRGVYNLDTKELVVDGNPKFVFIDSVANDTLEITGQKMTYNDSLKKATVQTNVIIKKGKLFSHSDLAIYYPDSGHAMLRTIPKIAYVTDSLSGDSVDMFFTKKVLQKIKVKGESRAMYRDFINNDTMLTHLLGDSLTMFMTDSGKIDSMLAFGNVKSRNYPVKKPYQVNEVLGKIMTVSFNKKGEAERIRVWGNAQSVYNIEEKDGRGINEASGDSIAVLFSHGKATHVRLSGSVRGLYAPLPALAQTGSIDKKENKKIDKDGTK